MNALATGRAVRAAQAGKVRVRAACAWDRVNDVLKSGNEKLQEDYKALARRFPALIHNAGLCQAVAFALSKGGSQERSSAHQQYLDDLAAVMGFASGSDLHERCLQAGLGEYFLLTRSAMDAAGWLSRYVEAVFPEKPVEGGAP
jgi:CRISPR type III-B/RAMP module-associated protein Cmr5